MRHIIFIEKELIEIAVLIKDTSFNRAAIEKTYITPLINRGIRDVGISAFTLKYDEDNKAPVRFIREYLDELLPVLDEIGTKYLIVADSNYFKVLTKERKTEPYYGYVLPCKYPGFEHLKVVLCTNYQALIYNPALEEKIGISLDSLADHIKGTYTVLGSDIIHSEYYPESFSEIKAALEKLHEYPVLAADIETFSLRFDQAGIATISFAWDEHNGIAFPCDFGEPIRSEDIKKGYYSAYYIDMLKRQLLKKFFETYKGTIVWHNASFDIKCIIYHLWMNGRPQAYPEMLEGLEVMTRSVEDTRLLLYLATNNTAGNVLGLKAAAHEFAGNWAEEDIKDIRLIPPADLLRYNLIDSLATFYLYKRDYPIVVEEEQEEIYREIFLPSLKLIIQMELCGLPMCPKTLRESKAELMALEKQYKKSFMDTDIVQEFNAVLQVQAMEAANAKLKVKKHPLEHFKGVEFNPNSSPQKRELIYEVMGLPVLDYTKTGLPATGEQTLEKLINHTDDPIHKQILTGLVDYTKVNKILGTFIPAFENGLDKPDGMKYLHGSFNLGGTLSGRLSSSDPNMQNLPANSEYARIVKKIFRAPKGWLFVGADFNSLEDMINALLTKDPNKLKVYTDGYDGHSLRAFAYFPELMPDIVETVESINSIKEKYPHLRQDSKDPTFACTYGGTWRTMVKNLGWPEEKAKEVEARYKRLYSVAVKWVEDKIQEAAQRGYGIGAFGLRIRTPLLAQVHLGHKTTPREAEAEARTLGNAISGQSYGLLNNRAAVAFMERVWDSKYKYDVLPVALIHDAIYLMIKDDVEVVEWVNRELINAMKWQELPEIQHPEVKLGAELDIFYPSWNSPITIPNNASKEQITQICSAALSEAAEAA